MRRAFERGSRITIYGDYDADGVAATAILVKLLREIGAECDWFIPDRITEGYGLNEESVRAVAARGTGLMITVDCGVASPGEVELAKELGMEVVITDHHQFGDTLPDCPILHPVISKYPFESLAGAGVAAKFASAIRSDFGLDPVGDEADLDLVALATVADVMPLVGENRRLVREGLRVISRASRVGMRALLAEAGVEPGGLSARDLGFKLGPRVNAVGRMYRADAGVELFLTKDPERAAEIGRELSAANADRRRVQQEVEAEARRTLAEDSNSNRSAIVVAGEGWHPGVVGIVASHLARDEGIPAVVIALEEGIGKGSGRSIPGVNLHAALGRSADLLEAFGGHAAAAGVTIQEDRIPEFREALDSAVVEQTGGRSVEQDEKVDLYAGGKGLGIELAEALEELAPFGSGNPTPSVLVPAATIEDPVEMGDGKHLRFSLVSGGHRARAVWFGRNSPPVDPGNGFDVLGELTVNHWKGSVEPSFRVTDVRPREGGEIEPLPFASEAEWWQRFDKAMEAELGFGDSDPAIEQSNPPGSILHHRNSSEAVLAEVISSGETVLIVTSEAYRRWIGLRGLELGRFGPSGGLVVKGFWAGSPLGSLTEMGPPICLTDYETLALRAPTGDSFDNVVLFDPPASAADAGLAGGLGRIVHLPDDPPARSFALAASAERHDLVPSLRAVFASLRSEGPLEGEDLRRVLAGEDPAPRTPERAATLIRILEEAGIGHRSALGPVREFGVVSSEDVDLTRSEEFRRQAKVHREQVAWLRR